MWKTSIGAGFSSRTAAYWEDLHWSKEKCEEEGVSERSSYGLTTFSSIAHSPAPLEGAGGGRGVGNEGVKLNLEKKMRGVLSILSFFLTIQTYFNC